MKRKALLATMLGVVLTVSVSACSSSAAGGSSSASPYELVDGNDTLHLLVASDAAPFASVNADGKFEGFDVALLTEITKRLDLKLDVKGQDFDTVLPTIAIGKADAAASSIADTDERRKTVTFSLPTYTGVMSVTVPKDSSISDAKDLKGKKVGVKSASRNAEYAEDNWKGTELVYFSDENAMFNALQTGSIDGAFFDGQSADKYVQQYDVKIAFSAVNDDNRGVAIVLRQKAPKLREAVNKTLREIVEDGTYKKIFEKWVTTEPSQRQIDFLTGYYEEHPSNDYPAK